MTKVFPRKNKKGPKAAKVSNQHRAPDPHFVGKVFKKCGDDCPYCKVYGLKTCLNLMRIN